LGHFPLRQPDVNARKKKVIARKLENMESDSGFLQFYYPGHGVNAEIPPVGRTPE
jgi:hypothetical protein